MLSQKLLGDVGYIRFNNSLGEDALVPAFDEALAKLARARAVVLDLRDTPSGGVSSVARGIMGRFVRAPSPYQQHELVAEFRSYGIRRIWVEYVAPREPLFSQPVVVLAGHWTGSMGEGIAIGLNATRNAPVLGEPMAHLLGALGQIELPNSKIPVRVPEEKLFHVNGTPREAFMPCHVAEARTEDAELDAAVKLARELAASNGKGDYFPLYLNFCPATAAWYINPPLATVNTASPLRYFPAVVASFFPPAALEVVPVDPALAVAEAVIATACTVASNSNSPLREIFEGVFVFEEDHLAERLTAGLQPDAELVELYIANILALLIGAPAAMCCAHAQAALADVRKHQVGIAVIEERSALARLLEDRRWCRSIRPRMPAPRPAKEWRRTSVSRIWISWCFPFVGMTTQLRRLRCAP